MQCITQLFAEKLRNSLRKYLKKSSSYCCLYLLQSHSMFEMSFLRQPTHTLQAPFVHARPKLQKNWGGTQWELRAARRVGFLGSPPHHLWVWGSRLSVIWSEVRRLKMSRAAAFWTCCRGRIVDSGRAANMKLPGCDLIPHISNYSLTEWQEIWSNCI